MARTTTRSAGILLYRVAGDGTPEVLLGHMGGPFWQRKDEGAWSIFKGAVDEGEEPLAAARREFTEETGQPVPPGPAVPLGEVRQASGKRVVAWAVEGDLDADAIVSNTFTTEWPPRSGRQAEFPEIDRAQWLPLPAARAKLVRAQSAFVDALQTLLEGGAATSEPGTPPRG